MGKLLFVANERFVHGYLSPLDLAELCAADGHVVLVAAPFAPESLEWNRNRGFQCIPLAEGNVPLGDARFCKRAADVAQHHRPDVVIGVNGIGFVAADLIRQAGFARRLVYEAIELPIPDEKPLSITARWQAQRARAADLILTTGRDRADEMFRRFELREPPLVVAGAPLRTPAPPPLDLRERVRRRGGRGTSVICCFSDGGTHSQLFEAIRASEQWTTDAALALHVSGGTSEWRRALRSRVEASEGRTVLLPWPKGNRDALLSSIVGAVVGLVLPTPGRDTTLHALWDVPEMIFNYLACGVPVVTGDAPSLTSEVEARGWGRSCDLRPPDAIALSVDAVFREREQLSRTAHALFASTHNLTAQSAVFRERLAALADE
jgi:hypothetical protein